MAKEKEKKQLTKENWVQSFTLIGEAKVNDYTFKSDEHSNKSDWIYNMLNLGVNCGEKHGTVYCELSGGYGAERDNVCYVHGKKDDGRDDFKNNYTIAWEDRFDEDILADIGDLCFLTVGLEKTDKDKTFYKKFLHAYDAIAYMQEHLKEEMVINVKGQIKYSVYNDVVQCKKEVNSIVLSKAEPDKYAAKFVQSMLLDKDSCGKVDKDKLVIPIYAKILEKFKEYNGHKLSTPKNKSGEFVPLARMFEFPIDIENPEMVKKIKEKLFTVKKGVTQITMEGIFVESGAAVTATEEDIPKEIKDLVDIGVFTLEEALEKCSENGSKERRMLITKPYIKQVGEEGKKTAVMQKFDLQYSEEDLLLDCLISKDDEVPFDEETKDETETDSDADDGESEEAVDPNAWLDDL